MMPEMDKLRIDLTTRAEFRDSILASVSGNSGKEFFATKHHNMDGIVATALFLPMRHRTLTTLLVGNEDNGFGTKEPMVAVTSKTIFSNSMPDEKVRTR